MKNNTVYAHTKMQRISARKARLVADLFRGKTVAQSVDILRNTRKKASLLFITLLNSAIANAVNNHGLDASKLVVSEVLVNEGPTLKRFQPHSRGTAKPILKRTSHLTIGVSTPKQEEKTTKPVTKEVKEPKQKVADKKPAKAKTTAAKSTTKKEVKVKEKTTKTAKAKGTK
ncbi:50S ribosomal protein L22 [Mycoplasmopsis californica]|nr:50S ribosomal protein L22 [Mycoplasmopsis californica]